MKGFIPFLLGLALGYVCFKSEPVPCPTPKVPVSYSPAPREERATRILDQHDRVVWEAKD